MEKKVPMRTCIACRECKPKKELIRIVKSGEEISLDRTGRKNGRGAYICPSAGCLKKARKTKAIARSLDTIIPDEVYEDIERQMLAFETK